jgi:hypothetical protein
MEVFHQHHQRLLLREPERPGDEGLDGLLALELGGDPEWRVAIRER